MADLLEVTDLHTQFFTRDGVVRAVDGVTFQVAAGETLGIVGESGCGKSVTALSLMRLIPQPPGKIVKGSIMFDGQDILKMDDDDVRAIRGHNIAMIFQDPMTSLNPVLTISRQISEALELHMKMDKSEARKRTIELLELVQIPSAKKRVDDYPHQFSGGMRQRVMIAMALSCNPKLILADEPTTALDVTIQAQILDLLKNLAREFRTAFILITHDLGVVAGMTQRINVMYAGRIYVGPAALDPASGRVAQGKARADRRTATGPHRAAARLQVRAALPVPPRRVPREGTGAEAHPKLQVRSRGAMLGYPGGRMARRHGLEARDRRHQTARGDQARDRVRHRDGNAGRVTRWP